MKHTVFDLESADEVNQSLLNQSIDLQSQGDDPRKRYIKGTLKQQTLDGREHRSTMERGPSDVLL